ncbi:LysR family transcriptional regulator [Yersinia massiliensis]|jgi:DNA-binding transcriptional LysR family regulator|uniref:LysR family transcriptional regulator n=2 Tax=Yersinia TaxID=629 RepID=A0A2R4NKU4_9GAMM|nr:MULTISPECIES: LysR family transcriptional regulator [Yersinia]HEC1650628.1 LysR family transcriptional regulator [Yersinia enterocolitica]ATM87446.1 LysR family transcriptional regulator [Yersinia frederiksenii]AVX36750.1 LysR family transcriptional regulator [Yersinia massiliensis]MCB5319615.1 LysR family transcriptional regulator [Yersinia massiliensis]MDA5549825.1 LysR family transcriptional regulator [Yersinia massiliensis]
MSLDHYPLPKDLQVLIAVVNSGSFLVAAESLGQTPAFVTKRIQQLELQLGAKLLHRSSRGVVLTESGTLTYQSALDILERLTVLKNEVAQIKEQPSGKVRIGCSFGLGRNYIAPAIIELMARYPDLQIHFELFDKQIDLIKDQIDLDIRVNDDISESYISRMLTKNQRIICASPEYLARQGTPTTLHELQQHDCLFTQERDQTVGVWELEGKEGRKSVKISGHLSSNSGEIILQWALNGRGIMLRSLWDVAPLIEKGVLVRVMPEYAQSANIWAVYQTPLYFSAKLRVCVEFFSSYFQRVSF